jgi:hypothetical protein
MKADMPARTPSQPSGPTWKDVVPVLLLAALSACVWRESRAGSTLAQARESARVGHKRRMAELQSRLGGPRAALPKPASSANSKPGIVSATRDADGKWNIIADSDRYGTLLPHVLPAGSRFLLQAYAGALDAARLSPEQRRRVEDLLLEQDRSREDASEAAIDMGMARSSPEMIEAIDEAGGLVADEIKAVIGEDAYRRIGEAMHMKAVTMSGSSDVSGDLEDAGVPLTPSQKAAFLQIEADHVTGPTLMANEPRNKELAAMMAAPPDPATGINPLNQSILDAAAGVLSPAQLAVIRGIYSDQGRMNLLYLAAKAKLEQASP